MELFLMEVYNFRPLPATFNLKNIAKITSPVCGPGRVSPHGHQVERALRDWFMSFNFPDLSQALVHLDQCNEIATYYFPDADVKRLEACAASMYFALAVDDTLLHATTEPDRMKSLVDTYVQAIYQENFSSPNPYAMMVHDISKRIQMTASPGNCTRYQQGLEEYFRTGVSDAGRRSQNQIPSISEYLLVRRVCVGGIFTWAHVEYALEINLPDSVFSDPVFIELTTAATDIMALQNDLVSFNKEQAGDEYLNFVCSIMVEKRVELQEAIDTLVAMTETRVGEYVNLKAQFPVFGPGVDSEVARYFAGIEQLLQGGIVWSYFTSRYFAAEVLGDLTHESLVIDLKKMKASAT
ncbi:hypothetical protein GALMADRAFT_144788 [Galerina marginata CBS 339.88]|uniref:Terpene synthase n=1 Tax=Galerina marginata (strain CBS 339.88) TaxID=685588 RepID=A0A067SUT8_GALM3|nr:hypothetical protein GALMADRAFT_144788 [Galerina marginata CBS 339.88]